MPGYEEKDLLHYGKWLCSLPQEEKLKLHKKFWNSDNPNIYRGLAPFIDNDPSHVEIFDMGSDYDLISEEEREYSLHEKTPWPEQSDEAKLFTAYMKEHYALRVKVSTELVSLIAEGLGKNPNFFDQWYK